MRSCNPQGFCYRCSRRPQSHDHIHTNLTMGPQGGRPCGDLAADICRFRHRPGPVGHLPTHLLHVAVRCFLSFFWRLPRKKACSRSVIVGVCLPQNASWCTTCSLENHESPFLHGLSQPSQAVGVASAMSCFGHLRVSSSSLKTFASQENLPISQV